MPPRPKLELVDRPLREEIARFLDRSGDVISVDAFHDFLGDLGIEVARSTAGSHLERWRRSRARLARVREMTEAISAELEDGQESRQIRMLANLVITESALMIERLREDQLDPKGLANLAKLLRDLSQALAMDAKRVLQIREEARAETLRQAEAAMSQVAERRGLSAEAIAEFKASFLGIRV